jgi:cell division protein FtsX
MINISKALRYLLIILLNILCAFVVQYYLNTQKNLSSSLSNLQTTIFINTNLEKTNDEILQQLTSNKFSIIDVFDLQSKDKFLELTPELENVIKNDFMTFPRFVIANNVSVNSIEEIEQLKSEILQKDFVEDFIYDKKAYKNFYDTKKLLNDYKKIFYYCFITICVIFMIKFIFYILKGFYRDIYIELLIGLIISLLTYAIICILALFFNQNHIFILDWQVLYIIVPLSFMTTLLTKESNV